ncbi:LOW QUALITY PROTEIN: tRNA(adenine(34)) deaminase, chloroplastic [Prosopis cineraria]|uniref:LOW QUALITY PROTEIN: tRNA(adenine(34)) deaminase, chloroplastic n=1 Tax=Prosopis cineraria TaxID=364024 RepID=UPI0024104FBD|nr:LOW QUALITY PROTEIN: tRNA(adenine(34)) deaminase, chloroplastic [Prosopis cineraria]
MHNSYFSSTIYAIRSKHSFSLSFNDYSNLSYERFDRVPSHRSSFCGCCDCCALFTCRVPLNPSLLFGLRQSTLLQLSASRRLILGGRDPYFSQLAAYGLHRDCYEFDCSFSERSVPNRSKRRIYQRCFCTVSEKESETNHSFGSDDAESVLNLLSEEADGNFTGTGGKNVSSFKKLDTEKKRKNGSRERNLNLGKQEVKKGNLKHPETLTVDLKKEHKKHNEEKKAVAKGECHGKRRDFSSCSSYYSFSSSGDIGSDLEVEEKHEEDKTCHVEEQMREEFNRQRNDSEKLEGLSNQERTTFRADIDCSLRKKSEKKLMKVTEEIESGKEPQGMHPRVSRRHESGYGKATISHKQFENEDDTSSLIRSSHKKGREDHIQTENRRRYQSSEIGENGGPEAENSSKLQNTFGGREGNLEISGKLFQEKNDERKSFVGSSARKDVLSRNYQKNIEKSKEDSKSMLNTRIKSLEEDKTSIHSLVGNMEERQYQKGDKIITQVEGRRKFQLSELSPVQESNVETASTLKSSNRIKNQEETLNLYLDVKGIQPGTDTRSPHSRKQSELVRSVSEVHASDEKLVSRSQRVCDEVRLIKNSNLTSVVNTRESYCQTDKRITQFNSSSKAHPHTCQSISDENISKEACSSQESLNLVSEGRKQYVILVEGGESSSDAVFIPSSSQLMRRGFAGDELNPRTSIPEVCPNTSESGSSVLCTNSGGILALRYEPCSTYGSSQVYSDPSNIIAPEDALASAYRLEESSKQIVDEFVQKARHEVTNETQEMEITGTKLSTEDEKNQIYSGGQQGTQKVSKSRERDSSRSSGFSGAKGPSDEMWDEPESSIKQSPPAEEAEASLVTENSIVKRTGRTLWGIISDIVRLWWHSRADASTSAARSGERNSLNKSDSDTWFSGQEHEETSKSKVTEERTSVQSQATTSDRYQPQKSNVQSEGDVFETLKLRDKGEHLEVGTSSSPNEVGSGSTSIGISFASGEENASWTEDGKDLQISTSGAETMESSTVLPARPPFVEEIVNTGRTESLWWMEDPFASKQTEISVTAKKDVELKQRKLQRNKPVTKDRFDEWEEAYKLELEQRRMDEIFMREALVEAKKAADTWEVPVGAVLVRDGKIISRGCNLVEELRDSTAHAEMICIREASNLLRTWRLAGTTLYVTLEPCPMCAGAILQARIDTLVWGAPNKLLGADGSWVSLFPDGGENGSETKEKPPAPVHPFHPKMNIRRGVLASECAEVMQQFFQLRRKKKREPSPPQSSQSSRLPTSHHHPSKLLHKMHGIFHMMFCL